ncbi:MULTISPECIES: AMP-binding enzyme [Mesorhizobium]|uniref:AMP-binding enzyme n=1 Tax=Mesorhizobium TaxID=68287 RepID=UPI001FDA48B9|nr:MULTISPECIES: thioesterase domain-containing protein [Mesorhizobium]
MIDEKISAGGDGAVEQIRRAQSAGHIRLLGHSLGGAVAFEAAARMLTAGAIREVRGNPGVPDELFGQAVKAFVVIEQGRIVGERQLQKECQRRLENFMVPKSIVIVPSLTMTDTGKLKKTALS